jgi:predicted ATP-grasp superfamily ATP-dependent carboligase
MGTPLLLVSTTTHWFGTARLPKGLANAGFDVALLTPRSSLAEKSRFLSRITHLPDHATPRQWMHAFATVVDATQPRIVVPCDDTAFRLLSWIARVPPLDLTPEIRARLSALIIDSLGNASYYEGSTDKTKLPMLAREMGVNVPAFAIVGTRESAEHLMQRSTFPVIVKRGHGFAGQGVAICANRSEITRALEAFADADANDPLGGSNGRFLLQTFVAGSVQYFHAVAWRGQLLAGWALEKLVANPSPMGPPTVTRYFSSSQLRAIAGALARQMGISGFFFAEFIIDPESGTPLLLEINRRVSPATHRGEARNVDLSAALFAALHQEPSRSRATLNDGEEGITVHFPQEWLRDPLSPYLTRYPSDVPWDEPELLAGLVGLHRDG